ncbi:MAG: tetratricopeptide repeat protein [Rhodocyclaceae bacterium]|nr:tetratricopeptide repeat protein [Rhodocyclaceae bacterium]
MEWDKYRRLCCIVIFGMTISSTAVAQGNCGNLNEGYGPFDYRTQKHELKIVEGAHFLPFVENLSRGNTSTTPGGDIDYTLRASPNHHRALLAMMKLSSKEKRDKPIGARYTIACWLDRAERFAPDDAMVKTIYGTFLLQKGKADEGVKKLEEALVMAGDNANIHYNLGLAYVDLKDYDKALASAHKAYQLGFPLPGLRNKLERVGQWRDLPPKVVATDEAPAKPSEATEPEAGKKAD